MALHYVDHLHTLEKEEALVQIPESLLFSLVKLARINCLLL